MIHVDAATIRRLLPAADAVDVLERALSGGLDPDSGPGRSITDVPAGQILLMPAAAGAYAGVKVATVAPGNAQRDLPRVQGLYVLFDGATLAPVAALDAIELTALRTPAVSAVAVRHLAVTGARRLVVFGTGPQALGHVAAIRAVRPIEHITVVGRSRLAEFAARCRVPGVEVREVDAAGAGPGNAAAAAVHPVAGMPVDAAVDAAVAAADIVACCTTARTPLFDGERVPAHATVVAVGSHEPEAREVDDALVRRSTVVVESRASALREAGDLIMPMRSGAMTEDGIDGDLAGLVGGRVRVDPDRPRFFKSTGMAWEDLVVAAAVYERHGDRR